MMQRFCRQCGQLVGAEDMRCGACSSTDLAVGRLMYDYSSGDRAPACGEAPQAALAPVPAASAPAPAAPFGVTGMADLLAGLENGAAVSYRDDLLAALPDDNENSFYYEASPVQPGCYVVTGCRLSDVQELRLPASHLGRPVVGVGDEAFADAGLLSVALPASVTRIGCGAFRNNRDLLTVTGSGVTVICNHAFAGCFHLRSVSFGEYAAASRSSFAGCYDGGLVLERRLMLKEDVQ